MDLLKKLGAELYARVIVSYKSTLLGLACLAGGVVVDTFTTYLQAEPHLGAGVGFALFTLLALAKKKLAEEAAVLSLPTPKGYATIRLLLALTIVLGILAAVPVHAQEAQPGGLLPSAGACFHNGDACIQPAVTVVPYVIDLRSGNVSQNIGFGVGYGIVFTRLLNESFRPGVDFLGGTQTGGGWLAAIMPRLGVMRLGVVVSHRPGATYAGLGVGVGQ